MSLSEIEKGKTKKVQDYKRRNKEKIAQIIARHDWTESELDIVIYDILCAKYESLNLVLQDLPGKTLDQLICLVSEQLNLRGNASVRVETRCDACGSKMVVTIARYRKGHTYCSMQCRDRGFVQHGSHAGINNGRYNSVTDYCTECGAPVVVPKYRNEHINKYGDHHVFCSPDCYWKYRSKYYVQDKCPSTDRVFTDDMKNKSRSTILRTIQNGRMPQTMTRPHVIANKLLENLEINYINEYMCKYYAIDIYLPEHNLFIEVMGDYWHGIPLKYTLSDLSGIQKKSVFRDKSKHTYVSRYHHSEILYLWESDLLHRPDMCQQLISLFVENNGTLDDYQSFNYMTNDSSQLLLKSKIIFPYFITKNA